MRMRHGRSRRGTLAQINVKASREKTYSAAAALMKSGMVMHEVQQTPYNVLAFVNALMDKLNADGKIGCYLIMTTVITSAFSLSTLPCSFSSSWQDAAVTAAFAQSVWRKKANVMAPLSR